MFNQISKRLITKAGLVVLMLAMLEVMVAPPYLIGEPASSIQEQGNLAACDDVLFLMRREITPDELLIGGGQLSSGVVQTGTVSGDDSGDIWALSLNLREGETQTPIAIEFSNIIIEADLEFAVFWGMEPMPDTDGMVGFQPLVEETFVFEGTRNGFYTIVVRLAHISDIGELADGSYQIEVVYRPGANFSTAMRDGERNTILENAAEITEGRLALTFPFRNIESPTAYVHAGAVSAVGTIGGNAAQTWFINPTRRDNVESPGTLEANYAYSAAVATWGERISYLAGDFSVTGDISGTRRVFFLENFGYQADLRSVINLDRFVDDNVDGNGTFIRLNWESISGFWMLEDCVGFHTQDGHEFIGVIDLETGEARSAVFGQFPEDACTPVAENSGEVDRYRISVRGNTREGISENHRLCVNWMGITPHEDSTVPEIVFDEGVFTIQLTGERLLQLESTDATLARADEGAADAAHNPLDMEILDREISLRIDWRGLAAFDYLEGQPIFTFLDDPIRTSTSRDGTNLARVEALEESIRLIYRDEGDSEGIADRLILSARDGYAEILTPVGLPEFNTAAAVDSALFTPQALNNVGNECYPINTMMADVNCGPNGDINPVNGNLWYSVVDHEAYGYRLDLTLARNYNSTQFGADGAFGYGWHTVFGLDYDAEYDADLNARPVSAEAANGYRLRLNLTWAPYGIVRFTTESGSQHLFRTEEALEDGAYFDGGRLTTETMPNWFLSRENAHSNWILTQADGLTYEFDRAGRLVSYGYPSDTYPNYDRVVRVNRLSESELGHWSVDSDGRQTDLIIITDAADMRRLELTIDLETHHIARSILRDMTGVDVDALNAALLEQVSDAPDEIDTRCEADENCFEIEYGYENGYLKEVTYPDGLVATYEYDNLGRLVGHDDPRAPIAPSMEYSYFNARGRVEAAYIDFKGERLAWRIRIVQEAMEIEAAATAYYEEIYNGGNTGEAWGRLTSSIELFEGQRIQPQLELYATQADGLERIIETLWTFRGQKIVAMFNEHDGQLQSSGGTVYRYPISNEGLYGESDSYTLDSIVYGNGYRVRYGWENGLIANEQVDQNGNDFRSDVIYAYHPETAVFQEITDATYPLLTTTLYEPPEFSPVPTWITLPETVQWEDDTAQTYEYNAEGWLAAYTDELGGEYTYTWEPTHQWLQGIQRVNDRLTTTYGDYNAIGQVGTVTIQASSSDEGDITRYEWDGLGRLIGVESGTVGNYQIEYRQLGGGSIDEACSEMRVTDPLGALTVYRFDGKGRLIERILYNGDEGDKILRHTGYEYDDYEGRISAEIEYLHGTDGEATQELITRYEYGTAFDSGNEIVLDNPPTIVEGETTENLPTIGVGSYTAQIDPYGRRQTFVYDTTGRIRETIDEVGHITRYDYGYYGTRHPQGYYRDGLRITQQDFYPSSTVQTDYYFNRRWQLNYVERDSMAWVFQPIGNSTRLERLLVKPTDSPDSVVVGSWEYDTAGQVSSLETLQMPNINLYDGDDKFNGPAQERQYDFLGRTTRLTDGEGIVTQLAYCPLPNGEMQVVQSEPLTDGIFDFGCTSSEVAQIIQVDSQERITLAQDEFGVREFDYEADPNLHEWRVTITFAQENSTVSWVQRYNAAGDLVAWTDDSGIVRTYRYDTLGRLSRVEVDEESSIPQAVGAYYGLLETAMNNTERDMAYGELRLALGFGDVEGLQAIFEAYDEATVQNLVGTIRQTKANLPVDVELENLIAAVQDEYTGAISDDEVELLVGVLAYQINPEGSFTFEYNAANLLTQKADDLGRGFAYTYNPFGQMTATRNLRTGDTTTYVYTSTGLLRSVISPLGNNTTYLYDDTSTFDPTRLTQIIDATGGQHRYEWDDAAGTLTYINPLGNETVYHYDSFGLLWQVRDAQGGSYEARYNDAGEMTAWLRPENRTTRLDQGFRLDYAEAGSQVNISEMGTDNWEWMFGQSPTGQIESITTPAGEIGFGYDGLGRIEDITSGDYGWSLERFDGLTQIQVTAQDGEGALPPNDYQYDGLNRIVEGDNTSYRYAYPRNDENGYMGIANVRVERDGESYIYTFAPGNTSAFQSQSPEVILRDNGQTIRYTYDTEGLLAEITTETCGTAMDSTLSEFDLQADVLRESPNACLNSDGESGGIVSSAVQIRYDERGRLVSIADSDQNLEAFVYNEAGNLITYRNQIGQSFGYEYDGLNRLTSLTSPGGIVMLLDYNGLGRVVGICQARLELNNTTNYEECVANGGLLEQYEYDGLSRLVGQRFPNIDGEDGFSEITTSYEENSVVWGDSPDNQVEMVSENGLSLLDVLILSAENSYTMDYTPMGQLEAVNGMGSLDFETDEAGAVEGISFDNGVGMNYERDSDGFIITDDSGTVIGFVLNDQGRLIGINLNEEPLVEFVYDTNAGELLLTTAWVGDGSTTMRGIDARIQNPSLISHNYEGRLTLIPLNNPLGQIQRQQAQGTQTFFDHANGYSIVTSYDAGGRPLVMRIADADPDNVTLLYTLAFTYDELGRRQQETRQYNDAAGTQIDVGYQYADEDGVDSPNRNQLISRQVVVTRGDTQETYHYDYGYDGRGNLSSVTIPESDEVCLLYTYDSANRLVGIDMPILEAAHEYRYDVYNRLVGIDEWQFVYQGTTTIPFMATDGDVRIYYVQTADGISLFQADSEGVYPLLHDGGSGVYGDATVADGPLWLFDPIGRFISLSEPIEGDLGSACGLLYNEAEISRLAAPQQAFDGMMWDQHSHLFFADGRAYSPEMGRYLQRDPLGADAFGNVYQYPSRQLQPPILQGNPAIQDGLRLYQDAMTVIGNTTAFTDEAIRGQYYPQSPAQNATDLLSAIRQQSEEFGQNVDQLSGLPTWLAENYNLPTGKIDPMSGGLSWTSQKGPGQDGFGGNGIESEGIWNVWSAHGSMGSTAVMLEGLYGDTLPELHGLVVYQPALGSEPFGALDQVLGQQGEIVTPNTIFEVLPRPLVEVEEGLNVLEMGERLEGLPRMRGQDIIDEALGAALPQHPTLPPSTIEALREQWFSQDIFGVAGDLGERLPRIPAPEVPLPYLGILPPNE